MAGHSTRRSHLDPGAHRFRQDAGCVSVGHQPDGVRLAADNELAPQGVHLLYVLPLKAWNNDIERNLRARLRYRAAAQRRGVPWPDIRVAVRTGATPRLRRAR